VIVCPNCGKENQDHYKFCLGCGSDLPRVEQAAKPRPTPTPPTGIPEVSTADSSFSAPTQAVDTSAAKAPLTQPEKEVEQKAKPKSRKEEPKKAESRPQPTRSSPPAGDGLVCASCGAPLQPGFAFCGSCGARIPGAAPAIGPSKAPGPAVGGARLVLIQPDGTEGGHVDIPTTEVAVGRDAGGFFASDPFLSPTHAIFNADGDEVMVSDAGSLNGVFVKIHPDVPVEIKSGEIFRMGQELVLFEEIDRGSTASDGTERMGSPIEGLWGRVALIVGRGRIGNAFPVGGEGVVFGRERGNILFPEDGYVSGLHLKLYMEKRKFYLKDLGSSNGTFVKITEGARVGAGSFVLMGQQLFRVDL
jgi:pSer/pThr/pTyr-binding forkhead associated (FHA) protein